MKTALISLLLLAACGDSAVSNDAVDAEVGDSSVSNCDVDLTASGWSAETHLKGTDGDYALLFDDDTVGRIDITICSDDYADMQDDLATLFGDGGGPGDGGPPGGGPPGGGGGGPPDATEDPIYVPVTVAYGGATWPAVGMRYKGNSSLMQAYQAGVEKLPFRLNFDYYDDEIPEVDDQRFHGFEELKFGNGFGDDALVRDKVAADLYREAGIPAAKGAMVEIYVDVGDGPVYWGVYTMFEDPCGELLDSWFGDDDGNCYKADGNGATLAEFDADSFENKTNDDDGSEDVGALVSALGSDRSDAAAWRAGLEAVADIDGILRTMAVTNLIGHWDTYGEMTHNYYLYADPALDGRLVWVPWDFNLSFAASNIRTPLSITMDEVTDEWPLIRYLMDDPVYAEAYLGHVSALVDGPLSEDAMKGRFEDAHAMVADAAARESAPFTNISTSFEDALDDADDAVFDWIDGALEEAAGATE